MDYFIKKNKMISKRTKITSHLFYKIINTLHQAQIIYCGLDYAYLVQFYLRN